MDSNPENVVRRSLEHLSKEQLIGLCKALYVQQDDYREVVTTTLPYLPDWLREKVSDVMAAGD